MDTPSSTQPESFLQKSSRRRWRMVIVAFPFALTILFLSLLASRATRPFAVLMTQENYPVELGTCLFALVAGVQALLLSRQMRRCDGARLAFAFYLVHGLLLIWVGLEEVDYGQWFFHWRTPEALSRINTQHEFNLHNIQGLGGHTEYLRLTFGVGGLIGVALSRWPAFRLISVPCILLSWFVVISALAAGDLYCDLRALETNFAKAMDVMSEVVELMISMSASLYLWLKARELRKPLP